MAWFGFGLGNTPHKRSYHARGGVSRALVDGAPDGPQTVEDVLRQQSFWRRYRGQAAACYLLGLLGVVLLLTRVVTPKGGPPGLGTWILGGLTLAAFAAPTGLWLRFRQQRQRFERVAADPSAKAEGP